MIEILGTVKIPPVEAVDENGVVGEVLTPEVTLPGWRAIVLAGVMTPAMEAFVDPAGLAHRVFYGEAADTVALTFPDEATGRAALGLD